MGTLEPGKGHLAIHVSECTGDPASGVVLSVTPGGGTVVYLDANFVPALSAQATTASGLTAVLNLEPGPISVEATVDGDVVATANAIIRADNPTYLALEPTRRP